MLERKPLISIIMPAYNAEKYIDQTIKSVLHQTYGHWQLIIQDDDSTDNTVRIARRFEKKDPRISVYAEGRNGGAGRTRNRALEKANGRIICFLDADDVWEKECLEVYFQEWSAWRCPWLFANAWLWNSPGKRQKKLRFFPKNWSPQENFYKQLLTGDGLLPTCMMVERSALEAVSPDGNISKAFDTETGFVLGEDWDLQMRLAKDFDVRYIRRPVAFYRIYKESTFRTWEPLYDDLEKVIEKHRQLGASPSTVQEALDLNNSKRAISQMHRNKGKWRNTHLELALSHMASPRYLYFGFLALFPASVAQFLYEKAFNWQKSR